MNLSTWIARDTYANWFRPYWFLIFCGFVIVILITWWKFHQRKIPTQGLYIGIFILVPLSLFGASIFGKLDPDHPVPFYELLEFWLPGMSIHGGLLFGLFAGWGWFYYESRRTNISIWVYADLIIPHILLAQSLGRWGNFFNHEVMGAPTSRESLMWLPAFIRDNMFKWYVPNPIPDPFYPTKAVGIPGFDLGVDPTDFAHVQYFQPIFLYESFANVILWLIIVVAAPLIFKYSYYQKFKKEEPAFTTLSYKGVWDKWYYDLKIDPMVVKNLGNEVNLKKIYFKNKSRMTKKELVINYFKYKWARLQQIIKADHRELEKVENPHRLIILRCGVQAGLYVAGYNLIRIILETQRTGDDLFLTNMPVLDFIVIGFFILFGILLIIFAQYISVYKWRQGGWLYEKQY
ncbi:prolipoprotein diacylglyceryl transferase [Spiroplasma eriocheiris]|uniref:Prolipoprotein diacylglyceryl transferase n=1 Tax=Spiroplasma eriocheiris TaxID=315358 RepID=A0A0H3XIB5_9MOLU|nr:prolipoprotein diacylglyceryl transferase family protein [Spiroplasma eriocheiris]AHF58181.1 prolipoprotein diacylglyceryl transferase [Spiroplasma eriocheiris CCTCC M 207170]AKM54618.1 prolipoprotein diacylglyceryl transferase [Spiroplasma eriocheiris]